MDQARRAGPRLVKILLATTVLAALVPLVPGTPLSLSRYGGAPVGRTAKRASGRTQFGQLPWFSPRRPRMDNSGFTGLQLALKEWKPDASLEEIKRIFYRWGYRSADLVDRKLATADKTIGEDIQLMFMKAAYLNSEGEAEKAYQILTELRTLILKDKKFAPHTLGNLIFFQAVTALRKGENENCIECRGESSCILPIAPAAVHTKRAGSEQAIKHFKEYLATYPDDLEVKYLLNIAYMTLGEYPDGVEPRYLLELDHFFKSEFDIGKFRDIGHIVGVNRFNQGGGAIMDDFDNDGLLDLVVTAIDPCQPMAYYHNKGDFTFEDQSLGAGVTAQLGGLVCYQTDYNNDGNLDIFIPRGAWFPWPIRPTLLRNDGTGRFTDVTNESGLLDPVNSNCAGWADYDNDGWVDLFVGCEQQSQRLYHNKGNGTFEEVGVKAGVGGNPKLMCKGCNWIDFDNDGYPDLFQNNLEGDAILYHNNRDGTFSDVTESMGIDGPYGGFSCWAFDYDNDGWLDIFATCYIRTVADVVKGMMGQPHDSQSNRLFHNLNGKGFEDVTRRAGLDMVFETMGSNFGDFDNDGFLDMYLATGEPNLGVLVPNRMFKNVAGERFADITASSRTGNLQKGHGVAIGDWDRDGDSDLFVQMGGAINGDKYHNILFQNPGQGNHWLTLKLVGEKTNRAAIGARIKVVTAGERPQTIHRHISSGSSFGANPLEQTIGLAQAKRVARLEIHWPTSGKTQVFEDIPVDQAIEVTEFATSYRRIEWKPIR